MLKNILFHLDTDDVAQKQLERDAAPEILRLHRLNLNAFQRHIPSIYQLLARKEVQTASVFCNKFGELNIVDRQSSRVIYGLHPRQEVTSQFLSYCENALRYDIADTTCMDEKSHPDLPSPYAKKLVSSTRLPDRIGVMVVLGIGLGYHIEMLLEKVQIDHFIIYEPDTSYFRSSISAVSWQHCLDVAKRKNTALYLQVGKDARDLATDISELAEHVSFEHFYLYKHLNHPVFNQVVSALSELSWQGFTHWALNARQLSRIDEQVPLWRPVMNLPAWRSDYLDSERFEANLAALKTYFPAIYKEFSEYTPDKWVPLANQHGDVNVFHVSSVVSLYGEAPEQECEQSIDGFSQRPNKDGLVLGYRGIKLKRYFHYQLVADVETVLNDIEESQGNLPDVIKSMIIFGLGLGYQLPYLFEHHDVQKLFICEPNRDFFYASLYAIDWALILKKVDESKGRLYLNIGDDGNHLINDLLTQFHSIGPYVLANTYFYQGYYNPTLVSAVAQLREQLQVIISMGDYFDHSKHGIAHTRWSIEQGIPFLRNDVSQRLTPQQLEVPIFLVGNGPSLDSLLDTIQEYQDSAIIVSCGTALQTLHRHGITPDFHAEIEINRATYDWATRIGDPDYLKQITLISCNGIHPDTCGLYRNTLLAFKQGESSTVTVTELYKNHPYALLNYAYPTVSNFATDMFTTLGFSQIYLLGIDMGFVDEKYHHSKSSGYYKLNGEELYDYAKRNDTSLVIEGNFRPFVKTKFEFKMSKMVMERTLQKSTAEIYNLNDGAKIIGTQPLKKDNVLILAEPGLKQQTLQAIHDNAFASFDLDDFSSRFNQRYQYAALVEELHAFTPLIAGEVMTRDDADALINRQRDFTVSSFARKKSLLFFYLNGTLNFVNSALSKVMNVDNDEVCIAAYNQILEYWRTAFSDISAALEFDEMGFDFIPNFIRQRQRVSLLHYFAENDHGIVINHPETETLFDVMLAGYALQSLDYTPSQSGQSWSVALLDGQTSLPDSDGNRAIWIARSEEEFVEVAGGQALVYLPGDAAQPGISPVCNDFYRLYVALLATTCCDKIRYIWPKVSLDCQTQQVSDYYNLDLVEGLYAYECYDFIGFSTQMLTSDEMFMGSGDRLRYLPHVRERHLVVGELNLERQEQEKAKLKEQFPR
ncbi:6-hydroxymethylpterin diphosphokinase MptE-like protein [Alteromonas sp. CYL-A6]|uniref:6-hydroxymethylpterin diphosphokinase MptE-like protein n=1 Tax=Alteromonas nitratireducens TaxID=3390813 RepID=UPI0034BCB8FD